MIGRKGETSPHRWFASLEWCRCSGAWGFAGGGGHGHALAGAGSLDLQYVALSRASSLPAGSPKNDLLCLAIVLLPSMLAFSGLFEIWRSLLQASRALFPPQTICPNVILTVITSVIPLNLRNCFEQKTQLLLHAVRHSAGKASLVRSTTIERGRQERSAQGFIQHLGGGRTLYRVNAKKWPELDKEMAHKAGCQGPRV